MRIYEEGKQERKRTKRKQGAGKGNGQKVGEGEDVGAVGKRHGCREEG